MTPGLFTHYDRSPVTDLVLTKHRRDNTSCSNCSQKLFQQNATMSLHTSEQKYSKQSTQGSNSLMFVNTSTDVGSHETNTNKNARPTVSKTNI